MILLYSQAGPAVGGPHTGPADRVPATKGVSGKNTLRTGPVERAVGCWNSYYTLRCANIYHSLYWDRMRNKTVRTV